MQTQRIDVLGARSPVAVFGTRDQRIAGVATLQRGRITQAQLYGIGISASAIRRRVAKGALRPLLGGVFAVGHGARIEWDSETTALLAVSGAPVLSHRSAAALWGLMPHDQDPEPVHVLVCRQGAAARGVHVHRTRILHPRDVRIRLGLPVTSPARTLLELAVDLLPRQLELAFDHALVHRLVRLSELRELLGRAAGHPGCGPLQALVDREHGPGVTRSQAEEHFLALVRRAELPEPEVNVRCHGWEIDFLWRAAGVAVEIDGFRFHSTRASFERDRRKDAQLAGHGIAVTRVTWRQIEDEPLAVIARLSGVLARRG